MYTAVGVLQHIGRSPRLKILKAVSFLDLQISGELENLPKLDGSERSLAGG